MKIVKMITPLLALLMLYGCTVVNNRENDNQSQLNSSLVVSDVSSEVSSTVDDNEDSDDTFTLNFYTDHNSDEYKNLGSDETVLSTGTEDTHIRFTSSANNVKVKLEYVSWVDGENYFHVISNVFEETVAKDKVYSFDGFLSETIPKYRITAEKGECSAVWYLQYDAKDGDYVFTVSGDFPDLKILEQGNDDFERMLPLMKAVVSIAAFEGNNNILSEDELFWKIVACAYTMNHMYSLPETVEPFYVEEWLVDAYVNAIFYEKTKVPEYDERFVKYHNNRAEKYDVYPVFYAEDTAFEITSVNNNADGTADVDFIINVPDLDIENIKKRVCLKPQSDSYGSNPFEWKIVAITDLN